MHGWSQDVDIQYRIFSVQLFRAVDTRQTPHCQRVRLMPSASARTCFAGYNTPAVFGRHRPGTEDPGLFPWTRPSATSNVERRVTGRRRQFRYNRPSTASASAAGGVRQLCRPRPVR